MAEATAPAVREMRNGTYRRIYAGFLTGRRINAVSQGAECAFWRLHALADDFGTFPADPDLLVHLAYPRRKVSRAQVAKWIAELANTPHGPLVALYEANGDAYGVILDFLDLQVGGKNGRRYRRHPAPLAGLVDPGESGGIQGPPADPGDTITETETENKTKTKTETETKTEPAPEPPADPIQNARADYSASASARNRALRFFLLDISRAWSPDQTQGMADRTTTTGAWDLIWPENGEPEACQARADQVRTELIPRAMMNAENRMAYIVAGIKKLGAAPCQPTA